MDSAQPTLTGVARFDYPSVGSSLVLPFEEVQISEINWSAALSSVVAWDREGSETMAPEQAGASGSVQTNSRTFEQGVELGLQQGREQERQALAQLTEDSRKALSERLSRLTDQFAREQKRSSLALESSAVKLAVAVAERILRREALADPLLLTNSVREALRQISRNSKVTLRIPQADYELWSDAMAHLPNLPIRPLLAPDSNLHAGDCVLEASLGSVDLGVAAQLDEIEKTLLPACRAAAVTE